MNNKNKGFTLIELMISISIVSILIGLASPSFSSFVKNNKIMTSAKNFYADINYAKSEALKGSGNVVVNATSGTSYRDGWQVFKDMNDNGVFDTGDIILRQQDPLALKQIVKLGTNTSVSFNSYGEIISNSTTTFNFCDDRSGSFGKHITITPVGLIKLTESIC